MKRLVLVRHGQSEWNLENRFTGWTDVNLSAKGIEEATSAGKSLNEHNYHFNLAFTSVLKRANETLRLILEQTHDNPKIIYTYRLNERHYGALQGLNKQETAEKYGDEQVKLWRRSASTRPPMLDESDPRNPKFDPKYKDVDPKELPLSENLLDTLERVIPCYENQIKPALLDDKQIIIAAHGNSLRALVMYLEKLDKDEIMSVEIPTGKPLIYEFDDNLNITNKFYL